MLTFLEYQASRSELHEGTITFPPVIVLRRVAIRRYPSGNDVAVYRADTLGTYFAYPAQFS